MTLEPPTSARSRASSVIEPLSPERYKIVFTADAELKRKLLLARDVLRHAVPSGDLATIVGRALDLLLDETLRRRFAKTKRSKAPPRSTSHVPGPGSATSATNDVGLAATAGEVAPLSTTASEIEPETPVEPAAAMAEVDGSSVAAGHPPEPRDASACQASAVTGPAAAAPASIAPPPAPPAPPAAPTGSCRSRHLPNGVRRTVADRDGLRCTWYGPDGTRCESRAWLEHDHIDPRGKGGGDDPANIQLRCQAHNHLAAEQTYGRRTIARIIARRRGRQRPGGETDDDIANAPDGSRPAP